ncbi:MAG: dipeptide epimerase [Thermoproteota archaeon]|nr:dipeptide epimerase [Candidatus Brockarchaeota archaeon]
MAIVRAEVFKGTTYYKSPFTISLGTSYKSEEVVIKIVDDSGLEGFGEASPSRMILGETQDTVISALDIILPSLIGLEPEMLEYVSYVIENSIYRNSSAKASVDIALHDLISKKYKMPLFKYLGGYSNKVLTDITIGIKSIEETVKEAKELLEQKVRIIKVKVGSESLDEDISRLKAIREVVGNNVKLFIDANQAWSVKRAIYAINKMQRYEIELVEQPVKAHDVDGLSFVKRNSSVPIMADESVHSPEDAVEIVKKGAADFINIKLMKSGGIRNARKIAAISESAGIKNIVGCMMEGTISIAAATHFACSTKNVIFVDLDSDLGLKNTLTKKSVVEYRDSYRVLSEDYGLGNIELAYDELKLVKVYEEKKSNSVF